MNYMKYFCLVTIIIFLLACSNSPHNDRSGQLAGMYRLFIIENKDSTGTWQEQKWAKGGDGYIIYDGLGHMAVQITPNGYKDFKWLTEEETINRDVVKKKIDSMSLMDLKAALVEFSSNYVYVANYSINDTTHIVQHNRLSHTIPSAWNTKVTRSFSFIGDTLVLQVIGGNRRLKWIKQK